MNEFYLAHVLQKHKKTMTFHLQEQDFYYI